MDRETREVRREKMYDHVRAWQASDMTQKQFCQEIGEPYWVFQYWLGKYRQEQATPEGTFARIATTGSSSAVEIVYPSGVILRLPGGTPATVVRSYLGV